MVVVMGIKTMLNVDKEYDVGNGDDDVLEKKGCGAGGCTPGINELPLLVQIFIKYYGQGNDHENYYDTVEKWFRKIFKTEKV